MTVWVARSLLLLAGLLLAASAGAQVRIELAPPAALECLQVPTGEPVEPVYPFDAYKAGEAGRVKATVSLPGGLFGNEVEIQSSEGAAAFVDAAKKFLRSLSAPCLKKGEKVTLQYEFVFKPDDRKVIWGSPTEATDETRRSEVKCIGHVDKVKSPPYPERARRSLQQGRVYGLMTFHSADAPPEVELLHRPAAESFAPSITSWAAGLRMPCHAGRGPVRTGVLFIYLMEGEGRYGFKALTLPELLGVSKGIRERRLQLDTTAMGCPFDVKLTYYQPLRRNSVGEVGDSDPRRRPLLELLAGLELELRSNSLDSVFADTADVAVPCVRINLNDPKEKTS